MYDNNEAMKISKYPILEKLKGYIFTNYSPVGKKKKWNNWDKNKNKTWLKNKSK